MYIGLNTAIVGQNNPSLTQIVSSLFSAGEQGVWYDPSDLSTLFQDAAGTVPVTAVGQPVGKILDKSGRGNHATQSTTTSRPVLSARVNLLTKTEQFDDAVWSFFNVSGGATRSGNSFTFGANAIDRVQQIYTTVPGSNFVGSVTLSGSGTIRLFLFDGSGATRGDLTVSLSSTPTRYQVTANLTGGSLGLGIYNNAAGVAGATFVVHDAQVESGTSATTYQRVTSAMDYDTVGFPMYLRFDGVDDYLVTNSIDFTATDKMTVMAGVRKLSDAATGILFELSADRNTNNGTVSLMSASGRDNQYLFGSRGTVDGAFAAVSSITYPTIQTAVLTGIGNISGDQCLLRVNGSTAATAGAFDQGTGNYGNYPLYIGRRGGTSYPFNGQLYGLVIRGALSSTGEIQGSESYMNLHTGAY